MTGPDGNDVLFTVTTDNCGRIFAVGPDGHKLAEVDITLHDEDDPMPFVNLARNAFFRLNADIV